MLLLDAAEIVFALVESDARHLLQCFVFQHFAIIATTTTATTYSSQPRTLVPVRLLLLRSLLSIFSFLSLFSIYSLLSLFSNSSLLSLFSVFSFFSLLSLLSLLLAFVRLRSASFAFRVQRLPLPARYTTVTCAQAKLFSG